MQTKSEARSLTPKVEGIANALKLTGWISGGLQLALIIVCSLVLVFAAVGRNFSEGTNPGIGIAIFWAVCAILVLCFSVYLNFRYTRIAKGLKNPNSELRPKKADTIKILRLAVIVGLVGMLLALCGAGSTLGVLVAKTAARPPVVTINDPSQLIRPLDIYVAVASINSIFAHFVGTVGSLWLLDRVHHN